MRIAVTGSRSFNNYKLLRKVLNKEIKRINAKAPILSGGARGADTLADRYAHNKKLKFRLFPADWENYGRSAGSIRNRQMVEYGDMLIAFWDGESRGTLNMIQIMQSLQKPIIVVKYQLVAKITSVVRQQVKDALYQSHKYHTTRQEKQNVN